MSKNKTGYREWADKIESISLGCPHVCRYCYAAHNAERNQGITEADWHLIKPIPNKNLETYHPGSSTIMFPGTHDIVPENLDDSITRCKSILKAGHPLLIVSKPHKSCIVPLLHELEEYKESILLRFSIGTLSDEIAKWWEPGAPSITERIYCLKYATSNGWNTSVSAEPLLGEFFSAIELVETLAPLVTDSIWIGKMNKIDMRVKVSTPDEESIVAKLQESQSNDEELLMMHEQLIRTPHADKLRFKDSITLDLIRLGVFN